LNGREVPTGEKHNQTTRTAATSTGDKVIFYSED